MNLIREIKAFRGARMNLDVAPSMAEPNHTREVLNMVEEASSGRLVNMRGFENVLLKDINSGFALSQGTNTCIGTCHDIETSSIIYFLHNDRTNHGIMQMFTDDYSCRWILRDEPLLNFQPGYKVKANVIGGMLFWTDGYFGSFINSDYNPPRKVNIEKAVRYTDRYYGRWTFSNCIEAYQHTNNPDYEGYTAFLSNIAPGAVPASIAVGDKVVSYARDGINRVKEVTGYGEVLDTGYVNGMFYAVTTRPWQFSDDDIALSGHMLNYETDMYFGIDWQVMDVIKHPPLLKPTCSYDDQVTNTTNSLKENLYQFVYRWRYDDNEWSVFSPVSYVPIPVYDETISGIRGLSYFVRDNIINVWASSGPLEVSEVQIAFRKSNVGNWVVFNEIKKFDNIGTVLIDSDIYVVSHFTNNEIYGVLDQSDVLRLYDAVPIVAKSQDIIEKNRIIYADYAEGFDLPTLNVSVVAGEKAVELKQNVTTSHDCRVLPYMLFPGSPSAVPVNYATTIIDLFYVFPSVYTPGMYAGKTWEFSITVSVLPSLYIFYDAEVSYTSTASDTLQTIVNELCRLLQLQHVMAMSKEVSTNQYAPVSPVIMEMTDYGQLTGTEIAIMTGFDSTLAYTDCAWLASNVNIQTFLRFDNGGAISTEFSTFKAGAFHPIGIAYYDRAGRTAFVSTEKDLVCYVPQQTEGYKKKVPVRNYIKWDINHIPPAFATHYKILYAKNTTKQSYWQLLCNASRLGGYIRLLSPSVYSLWTNDTMPRFGMAGYEFEAGDKVRFLYAVKKENPVETEWEYLSGGVYESFIIKEQEPTGEGYSVLVIENNAFVTSLNTTDYDYVVEIIKPTPQNSEQNLVYYEIGEEFEILYPHTESRSHKGASYNEPEDVSWQRNQIIQDGISVQSARGILWNGDSYVRLRTIRYSEPGFFEDIYRTFPVEDVALSDYYSSDVINIGRILTVVTNMRFQQYVSNLRYGGRLIQDTRINDLSRFDGSDFITLQDKYGPINSIEEVGDVLKVIQKSKVSGLYIGRAGITTPNEEGAQIMSSTKDVLGTLIVGKSSYGTVHPLSIKRNETRLYGFDFHAAAIWRDVGNGVQNISDHYGIKTFIKSACDTWGAPENVDVISGYDYQNEMVWMTFTGTGLSFTIGFRDTAGRNNDGFALFASFSPQMYGEAKAIITSFKNNALWFHNSNNVARCNFYGVQYGYYVTVILNQSPAEIKRFKQIGVTSNAPVACPEIIIEPNENYPFGQQSLLTAEAFTSVRGKYVADFGRNMLTSGDTASYDDLINGDDMEGNAMTVKIQGSETTEHKIFTVEAEEIV